MLIRRHVWTSKEFTWPLRNPEPYWPSAHYLRCDRPSPRPKPSSVTAGHHRPTALQPSWHSRKRMLSQRRSAAGLVRCWSGGTGSRRTWHTPRLRPETKASGFPTFDRMLTASSWLGGDGKVRSGISDCGRPRRRLGKSKSTRMTGSLPPSKVFLRTVGRLV